MTNSNEMDYNLFFEKKRGDKQKHKYKEIKKTRK
jgi:hypothetical protein